MNSFKFSVIPGRSDRAVIDAFVDDKRTSEPGIHNPCWEYGFRAFNTHRLRRRALNPGMTSSGAA